MIAILSDIHANLEALESVLKDMEQFSLTDVYVLGDIIGYGPNPNECVEIIEQKGFKAIRGNHERALTQKHFLDHFNRHAAEILLWTQKKLSRKNLFFLEDLPDIYIEEKWAFTHGSFRYPNRYLMESSYIIEEVELLKEKEIKIEFFGHTHMKVIFIEESNALIPNEEPIFLNPDTIYLVNPGAVGQSRDMKVEASYILFEPAENKVLYRNVLYDVEKTIQKMEKENFPPFIYNRLRLGI